MMEVRKIKYKVSDKFKIIDRKCDKKLRRLIWTIIEINLTSDYPIEATDNNNYYENSLSVEYMINNFKKL